MPRVSTFYGIVISMYFNDHAPPHFHATYGEHEAQIALATLEPIRGSIPDRAMRLVRGWATMHASELQANWRLAREGAPLMPIEPLP